MNSVTSQLQAFDCNKFFHTIKSIRKITSELFEYDNILNHNLITISINNNKIYDEIIIFSILLKSRLNQKLLTGIFKNINEINHAMADRELTQQLSEKLLQEKMFIEQLFKDELTESIEIIEKHMSFINDKKQILTTTSIISEIDKLIRNKEEISIEINEKIAKQKLLINEIKEQLDIITKSEDIIYNKNILDFFTSHLPSKQTISKLQLASSEKDILSVFIDLLKQFFTHLENGFSYQKLVETRHTLIDNYLIQIKNLTKLEQKKQALLFTLSRYYAITEINQYIYMLNQQLSLLERYWHTLIEQLIQLKSNLSEAKTVLSPHLVFLNHFSHHYQ
ncbi:alpha-xenorhabdolysin family binary toxin subunit B [Proteus mirabilis]|uniref:alpha-xenorhabdolysin family binary toxin subunit B n=1 Tax=Proteus mirabilis TaxID=584 RepID=UPI001C2C117F|nr:alpha-xenorhabdolysin family binary toxin subunit B [Proteus mirabilis]MBU9977183.1 alpha-xenorhabdolysin family binary toxin subunit B [Proteus mirabilis]